MHQAARDNAPAMARKKQRCLFCEKPVHASALCRTHYARSRPRKDGTLPTPAQIAGLEPRVPVRQLRRHHLTGRADDATWERLHRGMSLRGASSIHEFISQLASEYDPEADAKVRSGSRKGRR